MKNNKLTILTLCGLLAIGLFSVACDSPAEQAAEERIEDQGEAMGMDEDAAEEMGEAMTDEGMTDTTLTMTSTDTTMTTTTTDTTTPPSTGTY